MITVGLVKELLFISKSLNQEVDSLLNFGWHKNPIHLKISDDKLSIYYIEYIWEESLNEADSMFGIESCQEIANIIKLMDSGNKEWKNLVFIENAIVDKPRKVS